MIDLNDLIPALEAALTVPGGVSPYAAASEDEWLLKLLNGFWNAYNDGLFRGYTVDEDGLVSPTSGTTDMGRDVQQIIVLYAAIDTFRATLMQMNTLFRAEAGPVKYETQQSAQVLKGLLDALMEQRKFILARLSDGGGVVDTYYIDAIQSRDSAINSGLTWWVNA